MIQGYSTELTSENKSTTPPLVERVDTSIGEASTMIGAMLTEFMRRTLRNGVIKIDEEMQNYVGEKVDATIADRTPLLEKTAAEVAEVTARAAAADLVNGEVQGLEHRTETKARELASQIQESERRAVQATADTAERLTGQLEIAEKQAAEKAQELTDQVQELWTRSRRGVAHFKGRLKTLEAAVLQLDQSIKNDKSELQSEHAAIHSEFESLNQRQTHQEQEGRARLDQVRAALLQSFTEGKSQLCEEIRLLRQSNEALSARLNELERPRGIRALFGRVLGRSQATPSTEPETDVDRPS
jgi:hypothetical protein